MYEPSNEISRFESRSNSNDAHISHGLKNPVNLSSSQAPQPYESDDISANIPSVKPVVDLHDKFWAETDVLDDINLLAQQAKNNKSFFGEKHAEALQKLRASQIELAKAMASGSKKHEMAASRLLWGTKDIDAIRENIFGKDRLEEIDKHLKDTVEKLDTVASDMREVDEQSRDFWTG